MTTFEKLIAARLLTGILAITLLTLVVIMYNNYGPVLFNEVEHALAISMGSFDSGVAAR